MKLQHYTLILFFLFSSIPLSNACTCAPSTFCEILAGNSDYKMYQVEVIEKYDSNNFMDLKIINHLFGMDTLGSDMITIHQTDYSIGCGLGNGIFNDGDTLVISFLDLMDFQGAHYPTYEFIGICWSEYLLYSNDELLPITPNLTALGVSNNAPSIDYQTFISDPLTVCDSLENIILNIESQNELAAKNWNVSPNPTSDLLRIENSFIEEVFFEVIDISGRVLQSGNFYHQHNYEIDLTEFDSGIYFLKIYNEESFSSKKIVKI